MKKVIFTPQDNVVNIEDITNASYVGIQWKCNSKKIWVMQTPEGFLGASLGKQDTFGSWARKSKKDYCKEAATMRSDIYVFDSKEELISWLIS